MNRVFYVFCLAIVLVNCTSPRSENLPSVVETIRPKYARGFLIERLADSSSRIILLDLSHPGDTLQIIRWKPRPVNNLACISSTHLCFIQALDRLQDVKGTSHEAGEGNAFLERTAQTSSWINLSRGSEVDDEKVIKLHPDLFFVYPFGGKNYSKFLKQGIGCVQICEYLEDDPLGRAEWIKVFGLFLGEEQKAEAYFNEIESRYLAVRKRTEEAHASTPTVIFASHSDDAFFMPPGNSFIAKLITDAEARYAFADSVNGGNIVLPFEDFFMRANQTDYLGQIISSDPSREVEAFYSDEKLRYLAPCVEGRAFYTNITASDYFGLAILQPDRLLNDLVRIFHPELGGEEPVYFHRLKSAAIKDAGAQ